MIQAEPFYRCMSQPGYLTAAALTHIEQDNAMTDATTRKFAGVRFPRHFTLYMATIMAFLMSLVITFAEFGAGPHYMTNVSGK